MNDASPVTTPRVAVISNANSRRNRLNPRLSKQLQEILGGHGKVLVTHKAEDIDAAARRCLDDGIEILALNGGDGTNHHTLTAFRRIYGTTPLPSLFFMRGGTMNTVADSIGVSKRNPRRLLKRLVRHLEGHSSLPSTERHLMVINDRQVGFLFGIGFTSEFLRMYYAGGNASPLKGAWLVIRATLSVLIGGALSKRLFAARTSKVEIDGEALSRQEFSTIVMGSVREIGLGFVVWSEVLKELGTAGLLHLPVSPIPLLKSLHRFRMGWAPKHPDLKIHYGKDFMIENRDKEGFFVDGDFHESDGPIHVTIGSKQKIILG